MLLLFARRRSWATSTVTAAMIRGPAGGCSRPATSAQAIAFFTDLGLTVVGRDTVRGEWTETAVGLDGNHARVAMLQTPDGNGRLELFEYVEPAAIETEPTRPNEIGMHRVAFSVDDLDEALAVAARHGCHPLRGVATYEDIYRLTYVRWGTAAR